MSNKFELLPILDITDTERQPAGRFSAWLAINQQPIEADVPCGDCNACCRAGYFIHITPADTAALKHIPAALLFPAPGLAAGHMIMGYNKQGACPMLVDDACSIYEHRPQTCRDYDCRIFAATNIAAGGNNKVSVNEQAARWQFEYAADADRLQQAAVTSAINFLAEHHGLFAAGLLPTNPTQIALLAISIHQLFLDSTERSPSETASVITEMIEKHP